MIAQHGEEGLHFRSRAGVMRPEGVHGPLAQGLCGPGEHARARRMPASPHVDIPEEHAQIGGERVELAWQTPLDARRTRNHIGWPRWHS